MEKIIKNIRSSQYYGDFETCINGSSVSGRVVLSDDSKIESLRGTIKHEKDTVYFSAYSDAGKLRYSFNDLEDMAQIPHVMTAVADVVRAMEAELEAEQEI